MPVINLLGVAIFADEAHKGQVRKYTGEPYITHPAAVASILQQYFHATTTEMLAAALLHDTVEDTDTTIEQIQYAFGDEVAALVGWLTDMSVPSDGNRETRKAIDRNHTAKAPFCAQVIKIADLIHNTESIVEQDPIFAKVYLREKRLTLSAMLPSVKHLRIWQYASTQTYKSAKGNDDDE